MNEFEKNQNEDTETGQQGEKPAFGQLDKEQGQQGQQEFGQKGEQLETGQQEFGQKGEPIDKAEQQEQGEEIR